MRVEPEGGRGGGRAGDLGPVGIEADAVGGVGGEFITIQTPKKTIGSMPADVAALLVQNIQEWSLQQSDPQLNLLLPKNSPTQHKLSLTLQKQQHTV